MTTACPSCGSKVEVEDRFCGACGTGLGARPARPGTTPGFCTRCGGSLEESDRFCRRCGAPVRSSGPPHERGPADEVAPGADRDFFADWNAVFADEPPPREAVTEAVPVPGVGPAETEVLTPVSGPAPEARAAPEPGGHPPPPGFPWGATVALVGAVAVVISAILPWTRRGRLPREIGAWRLIDPGAAGGVNLGVVLLVAGAIGALVALLTMLLPRLGFLRRAVGILTLAVPVAFALRVLDRLGGPGDLLGALGLGVYVAAAGAVVQIVAGKRRA